MAIYDDLLIRILKRQSHGYPVELTLNNKLEFRRGYLSPKILTWDQDAPPEELGRRFFEQLISDPKVAAAWDMARGRTQLRRIRLALDVDAPELHAVPWELMHERADQGDLDLAAADATPFSRYLEGEWDYGEPIRTYPLKIAVAIANPEGLQEQGLAEIVAADEWQALGQALAGLPVELIRVPEPCTLEAIEATLRAGAHILHLIAHGEYDPTSDRAMVWLAGPNNQPLLTSDQNLADSLQRALRRDGNDPLRLVFLSTCQSATRSPGDAFRGLAPKLVQTGVPAVLAMQDLVPIETARAFSQVFYRQLLQHGQVDLAANQARAGLLTGRLPGAHIPVLFMRLADGQLLAPDPARLALTAMASDETDETYAIFRNNEYLSLPVEVVSLTGQQDPLAFEGLESESTAMIEVLPAIEEILEQPDAASQSKPRMVALLGGYGSNRGTQLKGIAWHTLQDALDPATPRLTLPIYVDLEALDAVELAQEAPLNGLVIRSLLPFWPDHARSQLDSLFASNTPNLRVIFDNLETLPPEQHPVVCRHIRQLVERYPKHQFILGCSPGVFNSKFFSGLDLHVLVLRNLGRRRIRHFLQSLPPDDLAGLPLLQVLDQSGLYDLAAVPYFMVKLVLHARQGWYPQTRTQALQDMIEDAVDHVVDTMIREGEVRIYNRQGMRTHVDQILGALAWQLHSSLSTTLPLAEAFAIMRRIRSDREYSLERLYGALISHKLLANASSDEVRFAYQLDQAYCAAKAILARGDRGRILDDITSTLGRLSRLHWWEDTIVFACGMMADDSAALESFLEVIVYGMNLLESDRTFLAARCLSEIAPYGPSTRDLTVLSDTVTAALIWRLSNRNEPNALQRSRAAMLLGQLASPVAMRQLAETAYGKPRQDRLGEPDFDYSNVRMAAIIGLLRMSTSAQAELLATIDADLVTLLHGWQVHDVASLVNYLEHPNNDSIEGLAALALGDLTMQLKPIRPNEADLALQALTHAFLDRDLKPASHWATAYALATIDLPTVKRAVIGPFLDQEATSAETAQRQQLRKCLAYLIGLLRDQDARSHDFLVQRCIRNTTDPTLAAVAIDALARLADRRDKPLLERLAAGNPSKGDMPHFKGLTPADQIYVQRKAIDALANIGDANSIALLRESRLDPGRWSPKLEEALYRASEEIYWRLVQRQQV